LGRYRYAKRAVQVHQGKGKAPNTINQRLASFRWYARKIADLAIDYGNPEDAQQAARVATVRDVKGERPERGRHIEQGELSALIDACTSDTSPAGIRDAAIIALAWSTGLRRDEISRIELADLTNQTEGSLDIAKLGKGQKVRTVYVNGGALVALMDWLDLRGHDPGALLVDVDRSGEVLPNPEAINVK
jgi:integrase